MSCRADACNRRSTREGKKESGRRDDRNPLYVWFQSLLWASRIAPAWGRSETLTRAPRVLQTPPGGGRPRARGRAGADEQGPVRRWPPASGLGSGPDFT